MNSFTFFNRSTHQRVVKIIQESQPILSRPENQKTIKSLTIIPISKTGKRDFPTTTRRRNGAKETVVEIKGGEEGRRRSREDAMGALGAPYLKSHLANSLWHL
jgi:hypothetical protein